MFYLYLIKVQITTNQAVHINQLTKLTYKLDLPNDNSIHMKNPHFCQLQTLDCHIINRPGVAGAVL